MIGFTVTPDMTHLKKHTHIHPNTVDYWLECLHGALHKHQGINELKYPLVHAFLQRVFINRLNGIWDLSDVWQEIMELMGLVLQLLKIFFTELLLPYFIMKDDDAFHT